MMERQVQSAIRVLEAICFLDRALASGSRYKATEDGLRRKPILFQFGSDYAQAIIASNNCAAVARGGRSSFRRSIVRSQAPRPSLAAFSSSSPKCPKSESESEFPVLMRQLEKSGLPPSAFEPNPRLEDALERLWRGVLGKDGDV